MIHNIKRVIIHWKQSTGTDSEDLVVYDNRFLYAVISETSDSDWRENDVHY